MRAILDFPAGFGTDPSLMLGPRDRDGEASTVPPSRHSPSGDVVPAMPPAHVPGPFRATVTSETSSPLPQSFEGFGGFRPDIEDNEVRQAAGREPQSVVVTTMVVGAVLAAMGYFLDVR